MKSVREIASKQNFSIGSQVDPKFRDETTNSAAFSGKNTDRVKLDMSGLRQANFVVGSSKVDYTTTSQYNQASAYRNASVELTGEQVKQ